MGVSLHEGPAEAGSPCHMNDYVAPLSVGWHELCKRHPVVLGEALMGHPPGRTRRGTVLDRTARAGPEAQRLRPIPESRTEQRSSGVASVADVDLPGCFQERAHNARSACHGCGRCAVGRAVSCRPFRASPSSCQKPRHLPFPNVPRRQHPIRGYLRQSRLVGPSRCARSCSPTCAAPWR